jgi:low temperature requirement protein LtrA
MRGVQQASHSRSHRLSQQNRHFSGVPNEASDFRLAHPIGHTELKVAVAVLGGPALFLVGNLLFKSTIAGRPPLSHLLGLGLLAVLTPAASLLSPLALAAAATAVLMTVATWETLSLKDTRAELREIKE